MKKLLLVAIVAALPLFAEDKPTAPSKEEAAHAAIDNLRDAQIILGAEQISFVASLTDEQKKSQARQEQLSAIMHQQSVEAMKACAAIGKVLGEATHTLGAATFKKQECIDPPKSAPDPATDPLAATD